MKIRTNIIKALLLSAVILLTVFSTTSCTGPVVGSQGPSFYDAGEGDLAMTKTLFTQNLLFRFDTSAAVRTLTMPSANDIISSVSSAAAGQVVTIAVCADGGNPVTIKGGNNVTVKPSAATIQPNTTRLIFCEFSNIATATLAVTIY